MREKIIGIYCIENTINGKKYIGLSRNIEQRWNEHRSKLRRGKHKNIYLQRAWNNCGEDAFKFYIMEICDSDVLSEREQYYITKEHTLSHEFGYNLTKGGEDAPTTNKMVISYKTNVIYNSVHEAAEDCDVVDITMIAWCKKHHNFMYLDEWNSLSQQEQDYWYNFDWEKEDHDRLSMAHSRNNLKKDTLQKLSEATKGNRNPRAFSVYCPELNEEFWGAKEAHDKYGICLSSISQCVSGKIGHAGKHPITGEPLTWVKVLKE
jgi:group I intron endonuclease